MKIKCPGCGSKAVKLRIEADHIPGYGLLQPGTLYQASCFRCGRRGRSAFSGPAWQNFRGETIQGLSQSEAEAQAIENFQRGALVER